MGRTYDNSNRARSAARTTETITKAAEQLLIDSSLNDITLNTIAARAEVTVQTVIRHMGSLEGCLQAVAERVYERVQKQREIMEPGNISGAIDNLIHHYEKEGKLVLNLLAREQTGDSFASELTKSGRTYHRKWMIELISPLMKKYQPDIVDALVAATDIYTWKLLRLDIGRSAEETKKTMILMVNQIKKAL